MNSRTKFYGSLLLAVLFCLLLVQSCKKNNNSYAANYGYNYYPTDSGHYVIYDVDSTVHNFNVTDTTLAVHYQWMQVIGDTFYDNMDNLSRKIYCYKRYDSTQAWGDPVKLWWLTQNKTNLQVVEDDLRFIKLTFPPASGATWNGNIYLPTPINDPYSVFAGWNYFYENVDTTYHFGSLNKDSVIVVSEVNTVNLTNKTIRTEMYAPSVGMVFQEYDILTKQDVTVPWDSNSTGFTIRMRAVQYNP